MFKAGICCVFMIFSHIIFPKFISNFYFNFLNVVYMFLHWHNEDSLTSVFPFYFIFYLFYFYLLLLNHCLSFVFLGRYSWRRCIFRSPTFKQASLRFRNLLVISIAIFSICYFSNVCFALQKGGSLAAKRGLYHHECCSLQSLFIHNLECGYYFYKMDVDMNTHTCNS